MLPNNGKNPFLILSEIEQRISNFADKSSGILSPHRLMECLKGNSSQSGLSLLGKFIRSCLADDNDFSMIRWVVFHFDLPAILGGKAETETRNWISLRSSEQDLLDKVHWETIQWGSDFVKGIYAPSIVAGKANTLRSKWWLYCLDRISKSALDSQHYNCCFRTLEHSNLVCFMCDDDTVHLVSCREDLGDNGIIPPTLGTLLGGEKEATAAKKYQRFANLIQNRKASEFPEIIGGTESITCNYYARIPVFFYFEPKRYMTEIFIAFRDESENLPRTVSILQQIVPGLRICVSLINSQVAYSLANIIRTRSMAGLLHAVLRHDLKNLGEGVDGSVGILLNSWDQILSDSPDRLKESFLEIRANTKLSLMSAELDVLWSTADSARSKTIAISELKKELNKAWQFRGINSCDFKGDWDKRFIVPTVCRVILSNLLRNAIDPIGNDTIVLACIKSEENILFKCLSKGAIGGKIKKQYFDQPISEEIPSQRRGLWICRYITENLLGGKLYLGSQEDGFSANVCCEFSPNIEEAGVP